MKTLVVVLLLVTGVSQLQAQHVRVRLNFPASVHTRSYGHSPFSGAIWIGPEWQWRGGRYVSVPGYWGRPKHHKAVWVPGYWQYSRRGYRWVPGHWR